MLLYLLLALLCQFWGSVETEGLCSQLGSLGKGWDGEVWKGVQSLTLGIQSYSDTEFLMHLVCIINRVSQMCVAVNGVKGKLSQDRATCS